VGCRRLLGASAKSLLRRFQRRVRAGQVYRRLKLIALATKTKPSACATSGLLHCSE
jgi:hypothetical protein